MAAVSPYFKESMVEPHIVLCVLIGYSIVCVLIGSTQPHIVFCMLIGYSIVCVDWLYRASRCVLCVDWLFYCVSWLAVQSLTLCSLC